MKKHNWKKFYDGSFVWDGSLICQDCGVISHGNLVSVEDKCKEKEK